ncbi:MAG: tetratricopeptide repeat protein, partial [Myxococcales bacterium]
KDAIALSVEKLQFKEDAPPKQEPEKDKKKKGEEYDFTNFREIDDPEARKLAHLGELLRVRNRFVAAVEEFERAHAKIGPRSWDLSNKYASALIETGALEKAEQVLLASTRAYPGRASTQQKLADIYMAQNRVPEAEQRFLEVIAVDPFDPRPHAGLLAIYEGRKATALATRERKVLELLAGNSKATVMSGDGTLLVRSHPYAKVLVDGEDKGVTTPARIQVKPGKHQVVLVNDERGFRKEQVVEVGPGEEKVLEVVLGEEQGQ